jgi:hypothetical protein
VIGVSKATYCCASADRPTDAIARVEFDVGGWHRTVIRIGRERRRGPYSSASRYPA